MKQLQLQLKSQPENVIKPHLLVCKLRRIKNNRTYSENCLMERFMINKGYEIIGMLKKSSNIFFCTLVASQGPSLLPARKVESCKIDF